jgi:nitroreductase
VDLDYVIEHRRMCRDFRSDPVDPALVDHLLELAVRAPSAGNSQGWSFMVLSTPAERSQFWSSVADQPPPEGVGRAPVIVVPLCSRAAYEERYAQPDKVAIDWTVPYWLVDVSFATMLLLLAASGSGLGALFFRLHRPASVLRAAFGVPDTWDPIGAVALGHPSGPPGRSSRGRRPLAEVVHRGAW